jgi:hypothetical protein
MGGYCQSNATGLVWAGIVAGPVRIVPIYRAFAGGCEAVGEGRAEGSRVHKSRASPALVTVETTIWDRGGAALHQVETDPAVTLRRAGRPC